MTRADVPPSGDDRAVGRVQSHPIGRRPCFEHTPPNSNVFPPPRKPTTPPPPLLQRDRRGIARRRASRAGIAAALACQRAHRSPPIETSGIKLQVQT
ncbi:uncharacterized protein LOC143920235 isoform X2 [Arctopsyche grandis]|uniref:uncharacterized protein LOC143920235 isoform X2 n=1 Tax=Arctopsyche grandis TaxID=121162 RepID=UPI00406D9488